MAVSTPTIPPVKRYTYIDDLTIVSQHSQSDEAAIQLQNCLRQLLEWLTTNRMSAEASASSLKVFTPFSKEHRVTPTLALMGLYSRRGETLIDNKSFVLLMLKLYGLLYYADR